jgi:hypothetical protein
VRREARARDERLGGVRAAKYHVIEDLNFFALEAGLRAPF